MIIWPIRIQSWPSPGYEVSFCSSLARGWSAEGGEQLLSIALSFYYIISSYYIALYQGQAAMK